jgi:hypothetical protein
MSSEVHSGSNFSKKLCLIAFEQHFNMMKFSQAISQVKWLSGEKTNISKTISVLVLRVLVWDRDGLRNVGFFTAQPFDPADNPRELHHTQLPGKQQIS